MAAAPDFDAIVARLVDAAADDPSPVVSLFLLRRYVAAPSDDLAATLGMTLARGIDVALASTAPDACASWLMLLAEAVPIADDDRIRDAGGELADRLCATWPADVSTAERFAACAASIDACLRASAVVDRRAIVQPAVDELERIVGRAYSPGQRLGGKAFGGDSAGTLNAHVATSSALLTAFHVAARLPYAMLAEELMHPVLRALDGSAPSLRCAAARVLCRLAALHGDGEYRAAAVLAPDADYRSDAARILRSHAELPRTGQLTDAACYGLALGELISLR